MERGLAGAYKVKITHTASKEKVFVKTTTHVKLLLVVLRNSL